MKQVKALSEEKIKEYLSIGPRELEKHYQNALKNTMMNYIRVKCEGEAFNSLERELILANSMPGKRPEEGGGGASGYKSDQMLTVLEKTKRDTQEYQKALLACAERAYQELLTARRFSLLYLLLPENWQKWLYDLYHEHKLWVEVEAESGLSHRQFVTGRKAILENLIALYESELDNWELVKIKIKAPEEEDLTEPKKKEYNQLSLNLS